MTTIRRELIQKFVPIILSRYYEVSPSKDSRERARATSELLVDAALELRGFQTNEEKPAYDVSRAGLEWQVLAGRPIEQEQIHENVFAHEATDSFEKDLKFNPLPWNSNKVWETIFKFVVAEYRKDMLVWEKYNTWRKGEGQYKGAMTNPKIYQNPLQFIAASFPAFLAYTGMYSKPKNEVEKDEHGSPMSYS